MIYNGRTTQGCAGIFEQHRRIIIFERRQQTITSMSNTSVRGVPWVGEYSRFDKVERSVCTAAGSDSGSRGSGKLNSNAEHDLHIKLLLFRPIIDLKLTLSLLKYLDIYADDKKVCDI